MKSLIIFEIILFIFSPSSLHLCKDGGGRVPEEKCFVHITPDTRIIYQCDNVFKLRYFIKNLNKENLTILKSICDLYEDKFVKFITLDEKGRWLDINYINSLFSKYNIYEKNNNDIRQDILKKLKLIKNNFENIILMREALAIPILNIDKDKMDPYFSQEINCSLSIKGGPNSPKLINYLDKANKIRDELEEDPLSLEN